MRELVGQLLFSMVLALIGWVSVIRTLWAFISNLRVALHVSIVQPQALIGSQYKN
jgi:hypothetical protein